MFAFFVITDHELIDYLIKIITGLAGPIVVWLIYRRYKRRLEQDEREKNDAAADIAFNYSAFAKVHSKSGKKVIEIELQLANSTQRKLSILSIFVQYKPLVSANDSTNLPEQPIDSYESFSRLPTFPKSVTGDLSKRANIAYFKDALWWIGVGVKSIRKTICIVDDSIAEKFPMIMAQVIVSVCSNKMVGMEIYPEYKRHKYRMEWCDYLEKQEGQNFIFYGRAHKKIEIFREDLLGLDLKALATASAISLLEESVKKEVVKHRGERVLMLNEATCNPELFEKWQGIDHVNTFIFAEVLENTASSIMELVIDLQQGNSTS